MSIEDVHDRKTFKEQWDKYLSFFHQMDEEPPAAPEATSPPPAPKTELPTIKPLAEASSAATVTTPIITPTASPTAPKVQVTNTTIPPEVKKQLNDLTTWSGKVDEFNTGTTNNLEKLKTSFTDIATKTNKLIADNDAQQTSLTQLHSAVTAINEHVAELKGIFKTAAGADDGRINQLLDGMISRAAATTKEIEKAISASRAESNKLYASKSRVETIINASNAQAREIVALKKRMSTPTVPESVTNSIDELRSQVQALSALPPPTTGGQNNPRYESLINNLTTNLTTLTARVVTLEKARETESIAIRANAAAAAELKKRLDALSTWSGATDNKHNDLVNRLNRQDVNYSKKFGEFNTKLNEMTQTINLRLAEDYLTQSQLDEELTRHPQITGLKNTIARLREDLEALKTKDIVEGDETRILPTAPERIPSRLIVRDPYLATPTYREEIDSQRTYLKDITGKRKENKVVEEHTVNNDHDDELNYIIPRFAPFFEKGLVVKRLDDDGTEHLLEQDVDYYLGGWFPECEEATSHNHVYGLILFDDLITNGRFEITYQTFGGQYTLDAGGYSQAIANYLENPLTLRWSELIGRPLLYEPEDHVHDYTEMVGWEDVTGSVLHLANTVKQLIKRDKETDTLFGEFYTLVRKLKKQGLGANDTTELKESFDGMVRKVQELEKKAALGTKNDALHQRDIANLKRDLGTTATRIQNEIATKLVEVDGNLNALKEDLPNHYVTKAQHATDISNINVVLNRLSAQDWNEVARLREHVDAEDARIWSRLGEMETNATNQAVKLTELKTEINNSIESKLSELKRADKALTIRVDNLQRDLNTTTLSTTSLRDKQTELEKRLGVTDKKIDTVNKALSKRIDGLAAIPAGADNTLVARNTQAIADNGTRIDELNARMDGLTNQDNDINIRLGELTTRVTSTNNDATALKKRVDALAKQLPAEVTKLTTLINTKHDAQTAEINKLKSASTGYAAKTALAQTDKQVNVNKADIAALKPLAQKVTDITTKTDALKNTVEKSISPMVGIHTTKINELVKLLNEERAKPYLAPSALTPVNDKLAALEAKLAGGLAFLPLSRVQPNNITYTASHVPVYGRNGELSAKRLEIADNAKPASKAVLTYTASNNTVTLDKILKATDVSMLSDRRLKTDIQPLNSRVNDIQQINGYRYKFTPTGSHAIGVIAQEVQQVFPELVQADDETGLLSVHYNGLIALLLEKVKQQDERIAHLESLLLKGNVS